MDDIKLAMLLQALEGQGGLPSLVRVRIGEPAAFRLNDLFVARQGVDVALVELGQPPADATERLAWLLRQLPALLDARRGRALVVVGASDAALASGLVARRRGCRLIHLEAGTRATPGTNAAVDAILVERMADALYAADAGAYLRLIRDGLDDASVHHGGSLVIDAVRAATHRPRSLETIQAALAWRERPVGTIELQSPFGLALIEDAVLGAGRAAVARLLGKLDELASELPVVWPMSASVQSRLRALDLHEAVRNEKLSIVEAVAFADQVSLLNAAEWVACDSRDVQLQASALHVRSVWLDERWPEKAAPSETAKPGDDPASYRIAEHFARWWHDVGRLAH
jgi:UDP-N-acetylglucosamine 2-epimerase